MIDDQFLSEDAANVHYLRGVKFRLQETKRSCLNALVDRLDRTDSDVTFDSPEPHCTHLQRSSTSGLVIDRDLFYSAVIGPVASTSTGISRFIRTPAATRPAISTTSAAACVYQEHNTAAAEQFPFPCSSTPSYTAPNCPRCWSGHTAPNCPRCWSGQHRAGAWWSVPPTSWLTTHCQCFSCH